MHNSSLQGLSYYVKTFGCQMNFSDSEIISGMLDAMGAYPAEKLETANIIVYVTCCVRENADSRFYGQVASIKNLPLPKNGIRKIAIGGCVAQRDANNIFDTLPHVDVVFGTHSLADLPTLLERALEEDASQIAVHDSSEDTQFELPKTRKTKYHEWIPIITGCDNFCSYCIVPYVRGREFSYKFEKIVDRVNQAVQEGVKEVTLLGQNVNSYGRDRYGEPKFAELLHAIDKTGIERVRFVSAHPKDLTDETIDAMATCTSVMPALHLALQSGSDSILKKMNRKYTSQDYLTLVKKLKKKIPDLALSTDIIVGFPGETEKDFEETLKVVEKAKFSQAFTFIYSEREGTAASRIPQTLSKEEIQDRFDRLVVEVQNSAYNFNKQFEHKILDVLVEGTSKKDTLVMTGKSPYNQSVNFTKPHNVTKEDLVGKIIPIEIKTAKTWYLSGVLKEGIF